MTPADAVAVGLAVGMLADALAVRLLARVRRGRR
jgi:hypothetical protein